MGNGERGCKAPRKPHLSPSRLSMPGWFRVNPTLISCRIKGALWSARKAVPGLGASPEQLHPLSSHSLVGLRLELALPWSVTYSPFTNKSIFSS